MIFRFNRANYEDKNGELMASHYPFKNLVFQGGGVKTFAYHGVVDVLESAGILPDIERVGGASAGALLSTLLSFRLSWAETYGIFKTCDFSKLPETKISSNPEWTPRLVEHSVERVRARVDSVNRLIKRFGWYASDYLYQWLMEVIADRCHGNGRATFADFRALGFRDVYVVVTNLSTRRVETMSADTTPDVAVADAVRISGTIPLFFEGLQFDGKSFGAGDYYADGGVMANYPLHLFDTPPFKENSRLFFTGINWETLGCQLYTPDNCPKARRSINNVLNYIETVFDAMAESQLVPFQTGQADRQRTINVSNCCVRATEFDIKMEATDERYTKLVQAGQHAARAFLENYKAPIDPRLALILRPVTVVERIKELFERPMKW